MIRETVDGFQGGLQIGGQMVTNLRHADDIIVYATSEAELQESATNTYSLLMEVVEYGQRRHSVPHTHSG